MEDMHLILRWHGEKDPISLRQYAQIPNLYGIVTSSIICPWGRCGTGGGAAPEGADRGPRPEV